MWFAREVSVLRLTICFGTDLVQLKHVGVVIDSFFKKPQINFWYNTWGKAGFSFFFFLRKRPSIKVNARIWLLLQLISMKLYETSKNTGGFPTTTQNFGWSPQKHTHELACPHYFAQKHILGFSYSIWWFWSKCNLHLLCSIARTHASTQASDLMCKKMHAPFLFVPCLWFQVGITRWKITYTLLRICL